MQAPDVSVILPFFNAEKTLARALISILSSDHKNIEVIAVDDGSTDSSLAICQRIASGDARVKIIKRANEGASAARNAGLEAARGRFFAFVDADDEVGGRIYQRMLLAAEIHGADVVQCATEIVYGNTVRIAHAPRRDTMWSGGKRLPSEQLSYACWGKLYLKEKFGNIRFDRALRVGEDLRFNLEVMARSRRVVFLKEALYRYTQTDSSIMNRLIEQKAAEDFGKMIENAERDFADFPTLQSIIKVAKLKNFAHVFSLSTSKNNEYCKVLFTKTRKKAQKSIKAILTCRGISVKNRIAILLAVFLPRVYKLMILEKQRIEKKRKRSPRNTSRAKQNTTHT